MNAPAHATELQYTIEPAEAGWDLSIKPATMWPEVPIMAMAGDQPVPLSIDVTCNTTSEQRYANCEAAVIAAQMHMYPTLIGRGAATLAPCVLVGSGPSAIPLFPEIRKRWERGEEIIAVKGAYDWLVSNGVIPKAAVAMDAQQSRAKCFRQLRPDVLYMCASQMHPDTWEHLKGRRVLIWHARIGVSQEQRPEWNPERRYLLPACSTTGNTALILMFILGRRNFELYGFDSSLPPASTPWHKLLAKLRGRLLKLDGARVGKNEAVGKVAVGGDVFETTGTMAAQCIELQTMLERLIASATEDDWPHPRISINAHGRGYYQSIINAGKAKGWPI